MAEWVIPVEHATGIPLVFAPRYDIPKTLRSVEGEYDWHHAIYPKDRLGIETDLGQAMRSARVQFVDYQEHRSYHDYFDGYFVNEWALPDTDLEAFGATVLLAAGYIPPLAIRSRRHGPEYVQLNDQKIKFIRNKGLVKVSSEWDVAKFLRKVVLQEAMLVDDLIIEEFLSSTDENIRKLRGEEMIAKAAETASAGIRGKYLAAYAGRLLLPGSPKEPHDFIISSPSVLGTEKRKRKARTELAKRLALERGIDLADIGLAEAA